MFGKKKAAAKAPAPAEEAAPQGAGPGAYVESLPRPENQERMRYTSLRVGMAILFASVALNLGLTAAVLYLLPLQRVVPYLVQIDSLEGITVDIKPMTVGMHRWKLLVQSQLERYVRMRHEVIPLIDEMRRRWRSPLSILPTHSSKEVYAEFLRSSEQIAEQLVRQPYKREVSILEAEEVSPDYWRIRFKTETTLGGLYAGQEAANVRRWLAFLRVARVDYSEPPTRQQALANPLGLVVTGYSFSADTEAAQPISTE